MKFLIVALMISLSFSSFSKNSHNTCITNGDCQIQNPTTRGNSCFIVKTGVDMSGELTCALRCYSVNLGTSCMRQQNEVFGVCAYEITRFPTFDPRDPNRCADAIDPLYL